MIHAPKFPLRHKAKKGVEDIELTSDLVIFHLKNLILTNPGEIISDPKYGVGIRRILFENMTNSVINSYASLIEEQISDYLSYIENYKVDMTPSPSAHRLGIKITFTIEGVADNEILELDISNSTGAVSGATY